MTDRGIIFSAPMVRALVDDRKTQTRRLGTSPLRRCVAGDRLWVRESFRFFSGGHDCEVYYLDKGTLATGPNTGQIPDASLAAYFKMVDKARDKKNRAFNIPSIHMPRWASRITLTVAEVRFERLQSISEADAIAEGAAAVDLQHDERLSNAHRIDLAGTMSHRLGYERLWNSLHTDEGERWEDDPEIVALTFTVARKNIDA